ncbi:DNA primase [Spiroplasma attinicola]|uniref:DNA primase n=1 Tax=Spiroplasma attinicola TaxID=2904537 RepID=UPI002022B0C7|nr:DNA primase [Spiroplasma sp. JKS002670]MCL8209828.1 DNA primase [Spiroplasma sp. JKS002670]
MDQDFSQKIQQIKEQVNIVDIVGEYLKLTRKGNNFWAICPFHQDSNPSLSVSQEKQIYKCFSCGEQGNVFIFLQKYKNIDFLSAVREVAKIAKIDLEKLHLNLIESQKIKLHPFKILNNLALNFYQYQMTTDLGKAAFNYLNDRKVSEKNINDFALGFAPSKNQLLEYLQLQGYQTNEIIGAGLAKITDKDKVKDMFFNRIIFPILDLDGECLGFSARSFIKNQDNLEKANFKYINTPETEIFKKGRILYNLYKAKNSLNPHNKSIYLVEGYMDVISLSSQEINNCVALMGTNLTKEHIATLKQFTNDIIIFLDGDIPGKEAAIKIATNLLAQNFNVKVIDNQTNQDPDELIKNNLEQFKTIINTTLHPLDFAINFYQTKYDFKQDSYQLKTFLKQLQDLWNAIKDPITTKFYLEKLKVLTNLTETELFSVLKESQQIVASNVVNQVNSKQKQSKFIPLSLKQKFLELQKQLFFFSLLDYQVYQILEKEKFIFDDQRLMNLHFLITEKYQREKIQQIDLQELLNLLKDNELLPFYQEIINQHQNKKSQFAASIIKDDIKNIKNYRIELKIANLRSQITNTSNTEKQIELLQQMSNLKKNLIK